MKRVTMAILGVFLLAVLVGPLGILDEIMEMYTGPKVKIGGGPAGELLPSPGAPEVDTGPKVKIGGGPAPEAVGNTWPLLGGPQVYGDPDNPYPGPGFDPDNYDWTEHHREIEDETE